MIEIRHDSIDGMRSTLSVGPDVVTSICCRYSSKTASISVELSESEVSGCPSIDSGVTGATGIVDSDDVSCSSSNTTVFRGDVGSPNKSHSFSQSFFFFLFRGFGLGIATIDGLLKHRKIFPAVDTFEFD